MEANENPSWLNGHAFSEHYLESVNSDTAGIKKKKFDNSMSVTLSTQFPLRHPSVALLNLFSLYITSQFLHNLRHFPSFFSLSSPSSFSSFYSLRFHLLNCIFLLSSFFFLLNCIFLLLNSIFLLNLILLLNFPLP